ncbi:MAG TPA: hypothetical protein VHB50_11305 [Bryobacteraceae bacterium]|nr:hypothetical protein [Bryobacteraceae bacterium]
MLPASSAAQNAVELNWVASVSPDVAGYNVYRGTAPDGPFAALNTSLITDVTYSDHNPPGALPLYYVVTAVDANGGESVYSNTAKAVVPGLAAFTCDALSLSPSAATACTVTLTQTAPDNGSTVSLSASDAGILSIPPSVSVPGHGTGAVFLVGAGGLSPSRPGTLTASLNGTSRFVAISVHPGPATSFSVDPVSVTLEYARGTTPGSPAWTFLVSSQPAGIPFTVTSSADWLTLPSGGTSLSPYSIFLKPEGLTPGTYTANLTFTSSLGNATVAVLLTVTPAPAIVAQPASVSLLGTAGATAIVTQDIAIASPTGAIAFTASSNAPWLTLGSAGNTTPATLRLQANPSGLQAGVHSAAIAIGAAGVAAVSIPVQFVISNGLLPGQSTVVNSASNQKAIAAPNTLLSLYGASLSCTPAPDVKVDGIPAAILYAGPSQINFLFSPAGDPVTGAVSVQVFCDGRALTAATIPAASVAPGIFTQSGTGAGPGSIENQDGSLVTPANPAIRGAYISVFVTGFGSFTAPGEDALRRLASPVAATIGGTAADVIYAGEAPGQTSGVQQINIHVPVDAPVGPDVPLTLTVGGQSTPSGVTLSIQQM